MTIHESIQEHVKNKCKDCNMKECEGIHITIDSKTRCDKNELHSR